MNPNKLKAKYGGMPSFKGVGGNVKPAPAPEYTPTFQEWSAYQYATTGKDGTEEGFKKFMEEAKKKKEVEEKSRQAYEMAKQFATSQGQNLTLNGSEFRWSPTEGKFGPIGGRGPSSSFGTMGYAEAVDQARREQFLSKAAKKGLSIETAQKLYRPGVTGRRPGDPF